MVAKLIKHELYRISRVAAIPAAAMLALAIIFRISLINYSGEVALPVIIGIFYGVAVLGTLLVCAWVGISRFYITLFTREGYMTLSLPVTADQLIISKLLSSIVAVICGFMVCMLSLFILMIGQQVNLNVVFDEIFLVLSQFFNSYSEAFGGLYIFESVLLGIISVPQSLLLFYLVMSIGQLATVKNRTVITVVIYFAAAFVWSIINEMVCIPVLNAAAEVSIHLMMWIRIIFAAAVTVGSYFIVRHIIKNKVNLIA